MKTHPKDIVGTCSNIQELIQKISNTFPGCESFRESTGDMKRKLLKLLKKEAIELQSNPFGKLYLDKHRIHSFFLVLQAFKEGLAIHVDEDSLGYFKQLKCVEFCRSFQDLRTFVLHDSGIDQYFDDDDNLEVDEIQLMYLKVMKKYHETCYQQKNLSPCFEVVAEEEARLFVLDTYLSMSKASECSFDKRIRNAAPEIPCIEHVLKKLEAVRDYGDLARLFDIYNPEMPAGMRQKRVITYKKTFDVCDDISIVYSYLQLKEIKIEEIIFAVDQILNIV
ncbi:hypothetical protein GINT2_002329 [Glugoides intestinalis]